MSTTIHIIGFEEPDDEFKKMKAVYDACDEAKVKLPVEVSKYFDYKTPNKLGKEIEMDVLDCCTEYSAEMADGYTIDITKLPKNIVKIRVYNSYWDS